MDKIFLYKTTDGEQFAVKWHDNDFWLTKDQISLLYGIKHIDKHVKSMKAKGWCELMNGNQKVVYYNLNSILSLGYRCVPDKAGKFLYWVSEAFRENVESGDNPDIFLERLTSFSEQVFCEGEIFSAYCYVLRIIKSATKSIVVIDNYAEETVLEMLSRRKKGVSATIVTSITNDVIQSCLKKFEKETGHIEVLESKRYHDRFIIVDDTKVYHVGASIKDLGKKLSVVAPLNISISQIYDINHL